MSLEAGTQVGPYRVKGPLGRGGMASVYTAYEPSLDRDVALKVLPAEFLHDPGFAERFNREARVIARLEHPNIVPIYAFGIDEARRLPWMAMRLVPGGALASLLKRGRLPAGQVLEVLRGVAEALDYAHQHGVVHRDVKPQNILLDQARRVYLADFGIAKMLEAGGGLTQTGMIAGTPQYMAPEQATATRVDARADIYAVGIVAYEMFTGHVPFAADTPVAVLMKQVSEPLPRPAPGEVPEPVVEALLRATAKRPEERWPTTRACVEALEAALALSDTLPHDAAQAGVPTLETPRAPRATLRPGRAAEATAPAWEGDTAGPGVPTAVSPRTAPGAGRTLAAAVPASPATALARRGMSPLALVALFGGGAALLVVAGLLVAFLWMRRGSAPAEPVPGPVTTGPPATASPTIQPPPVTRPEASAPATADRAPTPRPRATPLPTLATPPGDSVPARAAEATPPAPAPESAPPRASGPSPEVAELLQALGDGRRAERVRAARELGERREEAAHVVPALATALRDPREHEEVRWRAAEALGRFGSAGRAAGAALVEALGGPDMVATEAAKSIGKLGAGIPGAAEALGAALSRSDVNLRREAARALVKLASGATPALAALVAALDSDRDKVVRQQAADALGSLGPAAAASAIPALERAARDKDDLLALKAREALRKLGGR